MSVGDWVPFSDMSFGWAGSLSINCHRPCVDWVSSPYQWYELERDGSLSINCPYPFCRLGFESLSVVRTWEGQISVHKLSISLCRWVLRPFRRYKLERAGGQSINCPHPYVDGFQVPFSDMNLRGPAVSPYIALIPMSIGFQVPIGDMNLRGPLFGLWSHLPIWTWEGWVSLSKMALSPCRLGLESLSAIWTWQGQSSVSKSFRVPMSIGF